jgi:hypothetical protein
VITIVRAEIQSIAIDDVLVILVLPIRGRKQEQVKVFESRLGLKSYFHRMK